MDGLNFEGPAPRALERLKVEVGPDGQIVIDKSKIFLYEKGEWGKPGSFLRV
jgi:cytochrome b6-f complex iron-sulfur subunit